MVTKNIEARLEDREVGGMHDSSDNYVHVRPQNARMDAAINVTAIEQWEKELMGDPKV